MTTLDAPAVRWPLRTPPADYVIGNVSAVLPDRIADNVQIVVRCGRIAAVECHGGGPADVDGSGLLCLPGLIDVHSDGLERERLPRPGAEVPWEFALVSFEGKLRAAGITTVYHGASFQQARATEPARSVEAALQMCALVGDRHSGPVDHRVLHRLDVRSEAGLEALQQQLSIVAETALVSHEDHTPGQGQYADRRFLERYLAGTQGISEHEARRQVDVKIAERDADAHLRGRALQWLGEQARAGKVRLVGHDPTSAAEIEELHDRGGSVAEFPTALGAALAARSLGMPVVMGAPNVLRGSSHSGNVAAHDLAQRGLITALASDYLPFGLLAAVFLLAQQGIATLPKAVSLVTSGPAGVAGLTDRGALVEGLRADLVLVQHGGTWPVVRAVLRAE
ncbi:MAG: alpha-D-ribose 1-methylphosphonate 5-triphosphate diphosphatase [Actinomycetota bacterium]|nr:alpha-D-ribose 1-methylphosphonate 5-triphosphate diphosphatase [Actinomycetota bacterium]